MGGCGRFDSSLASGYHVVLTWSCQAQLNEQRLYAIAPALSKASTICHCSQACLVHSKVRTFSCLSALPPQNNMYRRPSNPTPHQETKSTKRTQLLQQAEPKYAATYGTPPTQQHQLPLSYQRGLNPKLHILRTKLLRQCPQDARLRIAEHGEEHRICPHQRRCPHWLPHRGQRQALSSAGRA